jgi:hypothetical protein
MATAPAPVPSATAPRPLSPHECNRARLLLALVKFVGQPQATITVNPIVQALERKGVYTFDQYTALKKDDFENLLQEDPDNPGNMIVIPTYIARLLQALLAIYHHVSRLQKRSIDVLDLSEKQFHMFRI